MYKWCKPCQINYLKENFIICEWIPYSQFDSIKEISKDDLSTIYSAKWKDGSLYWNKYNKKYIRGSNKEVALKYSHNLQNINEFLNEV